MKISSRTIGELKGHVTGDSGKTRYRSGPALVRLFNEYGFDESYPTGGGFPSRHSFAEEKIKKLNGDKSLCRLIEEVFDPIEFEGTALSYEDAISSFNKYLQKDGFRISIFNGSAKVIAEIDPDLDFDPPTAAIDPSSVDFIVENADKIRIKMREGDYRGAITNSRSLLEDVLCGIERKLSAEAPSKYNGDLPQLLKRVRKLLKMDAERYSADKDLFVMLNGLTSVVDGLAGFSNRAGDRHGGGVQPAKHHAAMIVTSAMAVASFVAESAALQYK